MSRACGDCGADISHRGPRAKRCEPCASAAIATAQRAASRRWRSTRPGYAPSEVPADRACVDCSADISHRGNRAKRCEGCAETARKVAHPTHSKTWRDRNPEHVVTYGLRYRYGHPGLPPRGCPEQRAEYLRGYRRRMRAQRRAYDRAWRAANPEIIRRYRHEQREARRDAQQRRRARKAALPWEPIIYRHLAVRDRWTCGLCHGPVDPTLVHPDPMSGSVDHVVPISKGGAHLYGNVQLAHLTCNLAKGDRADTGRESR